VRLLEQHGPVLPRPHYRCDCHIEAPKHERIARKGDSCSTSG
jgi:hypothetical protein